MRDKQIEEMAFTDVDILANDINQHCADLAETYCGDTNCLTCLAHALTEKGYRKSTDLAREIFEEIEASAKVKYWRGGGLVVFEIDGEDFAELKKKYTEDCDG